MVFHEDQISISYDIYHSNSNIKDKNRFSRVISLQINKVTLKSSEKNKWLNIYLILNGIMFSR